MFEHANRSLGEFIARHPTRHIAASLALAALCIIALRDVRIENDIRTSFSPLNSKSAYEFAVYKEFFGLNVLPERSSILFSARDGGSILRRRHLEEILALDARYSRVLLERDPATGTRTCDPQCDLNLAFHKIVEELLRLYQQNEQHPITIFGNELRPTVSANTSQITISHNASSSRFIFDFPFAEFNEHRIFIGMNFVNVRRSDKVFPQNSSKITFAKTIILWYFSRADSPERKSRIRNASLALFAEARHGIDTLPDVNFEVFGDEIANFEMVRGAMEATMLMSIGFVLLLVFMSACVHRKMRDLGVTRTLLLIAVAILCPLVSSCSAFGILTWIGREIYTIMCVTPFLICGIGVDDAFIILQSWKAHVATVPCERRRLGMVLIHVGPSIAITSLTNTVAFGIGYATPTPQMSLFCLCTSMAMFINYVFTLTILAPTLVLVARSSAYRNQRSSGACPQSYGDEILPMTKGKNDGSLPLIAISANENTFDAKLSIQDVSPAMDGMAFIVHEPRMAMVSSNVNAIPTWIQAYAMLLCSWRGRVLGIAALVAFLGMATLGVARMRSSFEPSKAFPSDSPLATSLTSMRQVFDEYFPINIFVNKPPNISDPADLRLFYRMVDELEVATDSYGENRTILWLRAYEAFDRSAGQLWEFMGIENRLSYDNLDYFLGQIGYPSSIRTYVDSSVIRRLRAFQFIVIAKNMSEWLNRAIVEQKIREVLYKYPFNATLYDGDSPVLNLLLTAKLDLVGSIVVTVACMVVICSFFIARKGGVIVMSLTITSICYTLVGLISWWGADLDPVTIVDVMLATGFSVDYTAHVAHQFYAARRGMLARERIAVALHEMLVPTLEASASTVLCMLPLVFVPTYAIVNFAKTIFAVVAAGLAHGLFFMPLILCALPERRRRDEREKTVVSELTKKSWPLLTWCRNRVDEDLNSSDQQSQIPLKE